MMHRDEPASNALAALLDRLRKDVGAIGAVFLTFRDYAGSTVVCDVIRSGTTKNWGILRNGEPPRGFDHDYSDDALGMRRDQWSLRAPHERHRNDWAWMSEDIAYFAPWRKTPAFQTLYSPNDFQHQIRAILVHDGRLVGWCAFFWPGVRAQRAAASTLSRVVDDLCEHGCNLCNRDERSHQLLLNEAGEYMAVAPGISEVFSQPDLEKIRRRAVRERCEVEREWCYRGFKVVCLPMKSGEIGDINLILLDPLELPETDKRYALTELQREVAARVASGSSNAAVADDLDVSLNTIKYHLKNIFSILDVTNRVELSNFFD